jgi:uncharacterized membrane protein YgcG
MNVIAKAYEQDTSPIKEAEEASVSQLADINALSSPEMGTAARHLRKASVMIRVSTTMRKLSRKNMTRKNSFFERSLTDNRNRLRENAAPVHSGVVLVGGETFNEHGGLAPTFAGPFVLHPDSFLVAYMWEPIRTLLVLYACTVVPVLVGFNDSDHLMREGAGYYVIETLDFLFIMDVAMGFLIAFYDADRRCLVRDRASIAKRYLQGWFIIDTVSAFPVDKLPGQGGGSSSGSGSSSGAGGGSSGSSSTSPSQAARAARVARAFRIFRIFRVAKIFRITRYIEMLEVCHTW